MIIIRLFQGIYIVTVLDLGGFIMVRSLGPTSGVYDWMGICRGCAECTVALTWTEIIMMIS